MVEPAAPVTWFTVTGAVLGSSVLSALLTKLMDRSGTKAEAIRVGYAEATRAMNAWGQFPFRIRRRTDDEPETLRKLEALGAEIQERLAYASGWVAAESPAMGELFTELVTALRAEVAVHNREAWAAAAVARPSDMNLAGPPTRGDVDDEWAGKIPAEWVVVQLFSTAVRYRSGWRRVLLPSSVLRRRFLGLRLVEQAARELAIRPARLLSRPD